jgi:hypothetical protein
MPIQQQGHTNNNKLSSRLHSMPSRILLHQGWRPNEEPWQFAPQPDVSRLAAGIQRGRWYWYSLGQYEHEPRNVKTTTISTIEFGNRNNNESMQREQALLQTVQNMTASVSSMEQRINVRADDVDGTRMDVEAAAAQDKML